MIRPLLCKLNIRHDWHIVHAEDGGLYKRCRSCGKDDDSGRGGPGGSYRADGRRVTPLS
jgi:hypothetical protein